MSETPQKKRSNNGRNRNRNRNNNNRNRNNNNNRHRRPNNGKPRNNRNYQKEKKAPQPVKLSWWQKLLQVLGLYKAPTSPRKKTARAKELQRQEKESRKKGANKKREEKRAPVTNSRLYVGNLSFDATESDLKDLFKGVGSVRKVEIVYHRQTHRSRGYGFIEMSNVEEAKRGVEVLHDQHFLGRKLIVNGAKAKKEENESEPSEEKSLA